MIKGISEIRRFPRLGVIRLGEKKISGTGREYPSATDHFVVNDYPEIQGVYGKEPKELDIVFPSEDEEAIFPQWYKRYSSSRGLVCRGDGETATVTKQEMVVDEHGKEEEAPIQEEIDCPGQECEFYQEKKCRRVASLKFMLPKVEGVGIWQLNTSSFNSIVNINSMIDLIKTAAKKKGIDFRTILFRLCVEPQETTTGGTKRKIHILQLRTPRGALVAQLEAPRAEIEQKPEPKAPEGPQGAPEGPKPKERVRIKLTPIERKIEDLKVKVGDEVYYRLLGMDFSVSHYNQLSPAGQAEFATELAKLAKKRGTDIL